MSLSYSVGTLMFIESQRVFQRLENLIKKGQTTYEDKIVPVDTSTYYREDIYEQELKMFHRLPILLDIASNFDDRKEHKINFRTSHDYELPLIITKNSKGEFHAFPNICRHRGAPIEQELEGYKSSFMCPYHAWCYDVKGNVTYIPEAKAFQSNLSESLGSQYKIESTLGGLWLSGRPGQENWKVLKDYFGPLASQLQIAAKNFPRHYKTTRSKYEFNWKFPIDAVLESYHISTLHRETFKNVLHGNLGLHDNFGLHSRNLYPFKDLRGVTAVEKFEDLFQCASMVYHLFPNSIFSIQPNFLLLMTTVPDSAESCTVINHYFIENEIVDQKSLDRAIALTQIGVEEDYQLLQGVARNLKSQHPVEFIFGGHEAMLSKFHQNIRLEITEKARAGANIGSD